MLLAAQWAVAQEAPPALRLADTVRPLRYAAELTVKPEETTFRGTINIEIEVQRPTSVVWLNARFLNVDSAFIDGRTAQIVAGGDDFVGLRP